MQGGGGRTVSIEVSEHNTQADEPRSDGWRKAKTRQSDERRDDRIRPLTHLHPVSIWRE